MSPATRKKCNYCRSMNLTYIMFDVGILQEDLNICIVTTDVPLATEKSNPTGTTFKLKCIHVFNNNNNTLF